MKKRVKKRSKPECPCNVPNCDRPVNVGWKAFGLRRRICNYHFKRHCNSGDSFSLFDVFNVPKLKLVIGGDRFGFPLPRDYHEMTKKVRVEHKVKEDRKKKESLAKLRKWKEENGNEPRRKPKPRPEQKLAVQQEMDDIVGDILKD